MGLELEGIWKKYFQPIPAAQTKGTHLQTHTCNREACLWPQSVNCRRGLAGVAGALPYGFSELKAEMSGCLL